MLKFLTIFYIILAIFSGKFAAGTYGSWDGQLPLERFQIVQTTGNVVKNSEVKTDHHNLPGNSNFPPRNFYHFRF
ncbi:hypothetical protein L5515_013067 [Caenorhabditis briggsae]|uniref:Uncharacterized protein n=1 Tax=Caenorhabditis briggsae TaxID=6238 RepID=A0AAE9EAH6_CAEBR|nr:hypothetical protein L5515_013067 [Caenorhabditis briggsae]